MTDLRTVKEKPHETNKAKDVVRSHVHLPHLPGPKTQSNRSNGQAAHYAASNDEVCRPVKHRW